MTRTRVKICGMTRPEDALHAVATGADGLGFIFYEKSPRFIEPSKAQEIIESLPPFVDKVGVFVNSSLAEIEEISRIGLTAIQLHGDESPQFCFKLVEKIAARTIIKAFRVATDSKAADFSDYTEVVDAFLLDTYRKGAKGGTGETFNWNIIDKLQLQKPVFLAGGLTPENAVEAIEVAAPFCLDVNSGVESEPGIKDRGKIALLMSNLGKYFAGKPVNGQ